MTSQGRAPRPSSTTAGVGAGDRGRRVGHVDLVHHAEHQREADADQRIGGAEQQRRRQPTGRGRSPSPAIHDDDTVGPLQTWPPERDRFATAIKRYGRVQDCPLAGLGVDEQVRLDRLRSDVRLIAEQALVSVSLARPSRIFSRSAWSVSGFAITFCSSMIFLRMKTFSHAAPCAGRGALELRGGIGGGLGLLVDRCEAGRNDDALGLPAQPCSVSRLEARSGRRSASA